MASALKPERAAIVALVHTRRPSVLDIAKLLSERSSSGCSDTPSGGARRYGMAAVTARALSRARYQGVAGGGGGMPFWAPGIRPTLSTESRQVSSCPSRAPSPQSGGRIRPAEFADCLSRVSATSLPLSTALHASEESLRIRPRWLHVERCRICFAGCAAAMDIGNRRAACAQPKASKNAAHPLVTAWALGSPQAAGHAAQKRANTRQLPCRPPVERGCARRGAVLSCMRRTACQPGKPDCNAVQRAARTARALARRAPTACAAAPHTGSRNTKRHARSQISAGASPQRASRVQSAYRAVSTGARRRRVVAACTRACKCGGGAHIFPNRCGTRVQ
jgi:hypothetical protein